MSLSPSLNMALVSLYAITCRRIAMQRAAKKAKGEEKPFEENKNKKWYESFCSCIDEECEKNEDDKNINININNNENDDDKNNDINNKDDIESENQNSKDTLIDNTPVDTIPDKIPKTENNLALVQSFSNGIKPLERFKILVDRNVQNGRTFARVLSDNGSLMLDVFPKSRFSRDWIVKVPSNDVQISTLHLGLRTFIDNLTAKNSKSSSRFNVSWNGIFSLPDSGKVVWENSTGFLEKYTITTQQDGKKIVALDRLAQCVRSADYSALNANHSASALVFDVFIDPVKTQDFNTVLLTALAKIYWVWRFDNGPFVEGLSSRFIVSSVEVQQVPKLITNDQVGSSILPPNESSTTLVDKSATQPSNSNNNDIKSDLSSDNNTSQQKQPSISFFDKFVRIKSRRKKHLQSAPVISAASYIPVSQVPKPVSSENSSNSLELIGSAQKSDSVHVSPVEHKHRSIKSLSSIMNPFKTNTGDGSNTDKPVSEFTIKMNAAISKLEDSMKTTKTLLSEFTGQAEAHIKSASTTVSEVFSDNIGNPANTLNLIKFDSKISSHAEKSNESSKEKNSEKPDVELKEKFSDAEEHSIEKSEETSNQKFNFRNLTFPQRSTHVHPPQIENSSIHSSIKLGVKEGTVQNLTQLFQYGSNLDENKDILDTKVDSISDEENK